MKGLGLPPPLGDRRGFMPPQLKTKTNKHLNLKSITQAETIELSLIASANERKYYDGRTKFRQSTFLSSFDCRNFVVPLHARTPVLLKWTPIY